MPARDREHHDARRSRRAGEAVERHSQRVAQHELLERDARAELQRARAEAADRAGRDLDDVDAVTVTDALEPQLGVDRSFDQPQRAARARGHVGHAREHCGFEARRRDVDGLFEVGADERVGLVEHGQHGELALAQQPLDGHFVAGYVLLDQQRSVGHRTHTRRRGACRLEVVGPDHALAAGAVDRLEDPRERQRRRYLELAVGEHERGLRHLGGGEGASHGRFVPCGGHGFRRVVREAEPLARGRGGLDTPVVDRHHRVDPAPLVEGHDGERGGLGLVERHLDDPIAAAAGQHGCPVGAHHHLDPEAGRGPDEVGGAVGRGGKQEENARHAPIMVA